MTTIVNLLQLTHHEGAVLRLLRGNAGVTSRDAIMDALYGPADEYSPEPKIVDVWICKLRKKLEIEIGCVWGKGYTLTAETRAALDERFGPLAAAPAAPLATQTKAGAAV